MLAYALARRVLAAWSRARSAGAEPDLRLGDRRLELAAACAAGLFALHPLRVESVAWLTERRDLVSGAFLIAALLAWCRYVERGRRAGDLALTVVLGVLAWAGKGTAIVLPALLLALDFGVYRRARSEPLARLALEKIPFVVLALLAAPVTITAAASAGTTLKGLAAHGFAERAAQAAYALAFYPLASLAPVGLRPIYPLPEPFTAASPAFVAAGLGVVVLTVLLVSLRKRFPALLAAWCAYVACILPVSGLLQAGPQLVAERYTYVACLPLALVAAAGFALAAQRALVPTLVAGAVLLATCGALAWRYSRAWTSSEALWSHALAVDADNPHALLHLGTLRYRAALAEPALARRAELLDEARARFERGLAVSGLPELRANLALVLGVEAERDLARRPELLARGLALFDEAFALGERRGDVAPMWRVQRASFLFKLGRGAEALQELERFVAARPEDPQGWRTLATAARQLGRADAQEEALRALARITPDDAGVRVELGLVLEARGAVDDARRAFDAARELVRRGAQLAPGLRGELERRSR
ncbi:MAG: hypothetical protein IPJ77_00570 [Planctomycetes bacterium]|nr:hypothetical protein [Planctomycetota bacterium]